MNKLFSKIATLSVGLAMAVGVGVALGHQGVKEVRADSVVTFTVNVETGTTSMSKEGVSVTTTSGVFNRTDNYRVYANNSMTVSVASGSITAMSFTISQNTFTADVGTWSNNSWSGDSSSVTLSASGGQVRFTTFSVTVGGPVVSYTITYDKNGGTGSMSDSTNTVSECGFTAPEGKVFSTWNTQADGNGTDYAPGATATADLDLYAIWVDAPQCVTLDKIGTSLASTANTTMETVDITDGSDTYTLNYLQCKKQGDSMFMTKDVNPFISNHTEIPYKITSVELFINSGASGKTNYDVAFGTSEFTTATAGIGDVNIAGGSSHVFENTSVTDAKYFCVTLGNSNNGQVLKIVVNYDKGDDPSLDSMVIYESGNPADGGTYQWSATADLYHFVAKKDAESDPVSGVTWSVSDTTVATINASTGYLTTVKPGNVTVFAEASGYNKASAAITVWESWLEGISVSGSMTKTSYSVGESWSPAGLTVTASYHSGWEEDVTSSASWTYNPVSPALGVTSVVATASFSEESASSAAQVVAVTKTNQIQEIYTRESGSVDVYGYYVGFLDGTGPVIMDGDYGIVVYNKSADVSSYTEKETILHVTGSISIYNGLYEVGSASMSVASSVPEDKVPSTPVVYATKGGETAEYASRLTTVTGTAVVTQGSFDSDAGTADIKMNFTVGTQTIQVFYKKAAQTADAEAFSAMKSAVENGTEITIKGFTGWYNGFQVQMNGYIPPAEDYTAEDFAQDLLDQTDAVCAGWEEGVNNHDALEAIWSNLASNDKYPSLPAAQKTILAEAERDESGTVVEQAMARYDFLTGKYNLSNFINGRTPIQSNYNFAPAFTDNTSYIIIIVISAVSVMSFGLALALRKKRSK